jgi:LPXTG-motif cell wall-anchored protein
MVHGRDKGVGRLREIMGTRHGGRIAGRMMAALAVVGLGFALVSTSVSAQEPEVTVAPETTTSTVAPEETTSTITEDTTPTDEETTTTVGVDAPEETTTTVDPESRIRIVVTPSGKEGLCVPSALGLQRNIESTDEFFRLTVRVEQPLCEPIEAKAVVYQMPFTADEWPQTLDEVEPFTIQEAGTYEVTFLKDEECINLQFDVLTGATPDTIAPLGEWHGPLLFPFDVATSYQWIGCPPPEVAPVTTIAPAVAGVQQSASLALTGGSNQVALILGSVLVLAGAALLLASRRRSTLP